jgi:uncharacterized protein
MVSLGVISDTHIPDRARTLPAAVLDRFREARVAAILHAGDVSVPRVLEELSQVAPVHAVRGNRDWWALRSLPAALELDYGGVKIGMLHGHGGLSSYLLDKARYLGRTIEESYFSARAAAYFHSVDVIVYGHSHIPVNRFAGDTLIFNPGSACCPHFKTQTPTAGLLHIGGEGEIQGEIIPAW